MAMPGNQNQPTNALAAHNAYANGSNPLKINRGR